MTPLNCTVFDSIPDRFLDCPGQRLAELLPGPCLIDLPGREQRPLFFSVLLHGNEDTGLAAAQEVIRRHLSRGLNRSLLLFVGNVEAAAVNMRTLPGQADYNRVWPGTLTPDVPAARMARWVFDYAASRRPFASIDIHNNTGLNPHYTRLDSPKGQVGWRARQLSAVPGDPPTSELRRFRCSAHIAEMVRCTSTIGSAEQTQTLR